MHCHLQSREWADQAKLIPWSQEVSFHWLRSEMDQALLNSPFNNSAEEILPWGISLAMHKMMWEYLLMARLMSKLLQGISNSTLAGGKSLQSDPKSYLWKEEKKKRPIRLQAPKSPLLIHLLTLLFFLFASTAQVHMQLVLMPVEGNLSQKIKIFVSPILKGAKRSPDWFLLLVVSITGALFIYSCLTCPFIDS